MSTPDLSDAISAVDAQIAAIKTAIVAGTTNPAGVQTLNVAGRTIVYTDPAEALTKLVNLRLELQTLQGRLDETIPMFTRTRVEGVGRW